MRRPGALFLYSSRFDSSPSQHTIKHMSMDGRYEYKMGLYDHIRQSDEKVLLARSVGKIIRENDVKSLLDVGAGEGTFASMIAPQVNRYVAAEKREENARELRDRGLTVIEQNFPFEIEDKFDMVLASHSVPDDKATIESFIENLVSTTKKDGVVCTITFKREKDLWYEFMKGVMSENWDKKNFDTYEMLLDVLRPYGAVAVEKIDTNIQGRNPKELFDALRFTYAGKEPRLVDLFNQHGAEGIAWIKKHCEQGGDGFYKFPFIQYVITLKKDGTRNSVPDPKSGT